MSKNETIYKVYQDIYDTPKETMYLRPLGLGIGTGIGAFVEYEMLPDNNIFTGICIGTAAFLLGRGLYNSYKFKKLKKESELGRERLEIFQKEAKKVLNKDINLDCDNVSALVDFGFSPENFSCNTIFRDGGCITEIICDGDYDCEYYKIPKNGSVAVNGINLNFAVDKAYSMMPSKKKRKKDNK